MHSHRHWQQLLLLHANLPSYRHYTCSHRAWLCAHATLVSIC